MRITRQHLKRLIQEALGDDDPMGSGDAPLLEPEMEELPDTQHFVAQPLGGHPGSYQIPVATLGELISRLQLLQEKHGPNIEVVTTLQDGEWMAGHGPVSPEFIMVRDDYEPDQGESGSDSLREGDYISVGYILS